MALISLTEAKNHLRVDQSVEDDTIQIYINASIDYIAKYLNTDDYPESPSIKASALLIVGDLYENRASNLDYKTYKNSTVDALLSPYRERMGL